MPKVNVCSDTCKDFKLTNPTCGNILFQESAWQRAELYPHASTVMQASSFFLFCRKEREHLEPIHSDSENYWKSIHCEWAANSSLLGNSTIYWRERERTKANVIRTHPNWDPIMIVICTSKALVHHSTYETRYRLHYLAKHQAATTVKPCPHVYAIIRVIIPCKLLFFYLLYWTFIF